MSMLNTTGKDIVISNGKMGFVDILFVVVFIRKVLLSFVSSGIHKNMSRHFGFLGRIKKRLPGLFECGKACIFLKITLILYFVNSKTVKIFWLYQMPMMCCIRRLTDAIPTQHVKPVRIGFAPVFTNFTMLVFIPIAAIAMTIKNLLKVLNGAVMSAGRWKMVVMIDASKKKRTKKGKALLKLKVDPSCFFVSFP